MHAYCVWAVLLVVGAWNTLDIYMYPYISHIRQYSCDWRSGICVSVLCTVGYASTMCLEYLGYVCIIILAI